MKFRTKYIEGIGLFCQVKISIFRPWQKIGRHVDGFGLYDESDESCPLKTEDEAIEQFQHYKQWVEYRKSRPKYKSVDI
jgi:hypothetical protein